VRLTDPTYAELRERKRARASGPNFYRESLAARIPDVGLRRSLQAS
jgi:hypothetical protein